jgi:nicotinate-nucleotide adenylyltransferase
MCSGVGSSGPPADASSREGGSTGYAVFGGTFDPVHWGHLVAAQEVLETCGFDEILFIPNKVPPHKGREGGPAPGDERYIMLCLATASNPAFRVLRIELDRPEASYTVDTIRQLRGLYPSRPVSLITGVDALLNYEWKEFNDLLSGLAALVVVTRPGFSAADLDEKLKGMGLKDIEKIRFITMPDIGISSTDVRRRLREGRSVRYLVPREVEDYLHKSRLYT